MLKRIKAHLIGWVAMTLIAILSACGTTDDDQGKSFADQLEEAREIEQQLQEEADKQRDAIDEQMQ
jgi:hypothetical protein